MNEKEEEGKGILQKGRIAVILILVMTGILTWAGNISGEQYLEIVKLIGLVWLGAEAGNAIPGR